MIDMVTVRERQHESWNLDIYVSNRFNTDIKCYSNINQCKYDDTQYNFY